MNKWGAWGSIFGQHSESSKYVQQNIATHPQSLRIENHRTPIKNKRNNEVAWLFFAVFSPSRAPTEPLFEDADFSNLTNKEVIWALADDRRLALIKYVITGNSWP